MMSQIHCKQSIRIEKSGSLNIIFPVIWEGTFCLRFVTIPVTKTYKKPLCPTRSPVKKRGTRQALCLRMQPRKHSERQRLSVV